MIGTVGLSLSEYFGFIQNMKQVDQKNINIR